jgi:urocanate hydratase
VTLKTFKEQILQGIPDELPPVKEYDLQVSHAPKRKDILNPGGKEACHSKTLFGISTPGITKFWRLSFMKNFSRFGRIYMYRFRPDYPMFASDLFMNIHINPCRLQLSC